MEVCPIDADSTVGYGRVFLSDAGPIRLLGFLLEFNPALFAEFDSSLVKVPPNTTLTMEPVDT